MCDKVVADYHELVSRHPGLTRTRGATVGGTAPTPETVPIKDRSPIAELTEREVAIIPTRAVADGRENGVSDSGTETVEPGHP